MRRPGSTQELKERCHRIRDTLRFRALAGGLVTETEIEQYWPGGEENPTRDRWGWIFCFASMTRMSDRLRDLKKVESKSTAEADRDVLDALRAEPARVQFPDESKAVFVHPKSFDALQWFAARDEIIGWLNTQRRRVADNAIPDALDLAERTGREVAYQYGLLAWAATHRGPGLPWEQDHIPSVLPDEIASLSPLDVLLVIRAFVEVNASRLQALQRMLSDKLTGTEARPSWATFFASSADQHHADTESLMRDRALTKLVASALLAADARVRAMDADKSAN